MTVLLAGMTESLKATWGTPGVSEFLSAALGGLLAMAAQWLALRHDRQKEEAKQRNENKGTAWAIYFKISQTFEQFTWVWDELQSARELADKSKRQLWQVFQPPPHDLKPVQLETRELVLLIDHKQFDLMERYRLAIIWNANLSQSLQKFGEMRMEFLMSVPSDMTGEGQGSFFVDDRNRREVMPRISFLQSLCDSTETVVKQQRPDLRQLLLDYVEAMKPMTGKWPELQLTDEAKAGHQATLR